MSRIVRATPANVRAMLGLMLGLNRPFQIQMLGLLGLFVDSLHIREKNGKKKWGGELEVSPNSPHSPHIFQGVMA